jgi:hypothetical protein
MIDSRSDITRRDAVKITTLLVGGVVLMAGCGGGDEQPAAGDAALGAEDLRLLEDVADTLLPATAASPGARAAGAGEGMRLLLADCYEPAASQRVLAGLATLRARGFTALPVAERERVLRAVDAEAVKAGPEHWFHLVREVAQRAYFSSEVGMTKALRWTMVPGRWQGCVPLAPGQPAWG